MSAPEIPQEVTDKAGRIWTLARASGSFRSNDVHQFTGTFTLAAAARPLRNPFEDPRVGDRVLDGEGDSWEVIAVARDGVLILYTRTETDLDGHDVVTSFCPRARTRAEFRAAQEDGWSVDRLAGDA